jgi:hypothetical protein
MITLTTMKNIQDIRKFENFHILLWLLKDLCWVTLSRTAGMFMIVPTLALAIFITVKNRRDIAEFTHNLAVCFWICANSVWMFGEFYMQDGTRHFAIIFFLLGLFSMAYYYIIESFKLYSKQSKKAE